ncbi:MAG: thermonuclease family protein [Clostridiales bacterium]|nr:thermonuclease family protein [Clostridiales bacterium]MCF8022149.1 thermonuclease family protein [Clostridiales bacterium]
MPGGKKEKLRLIGIDTPESTREIEPYGKKASSYTKNRLDGEKIWLEKDVEERDRYNRFLVYIWLSEPEKKIKEEVREKMFNAELLLKGYAQLMTVPPNVKYVDYFKEYQREARKADRGLWELKEENTEDYYVGSKNSDKFHRPGCKWAQKIDEDNLLRFESRDEAYDAGYQPCEWCDP